MRTPTKLENFLWAVAACAFVLWLAYVTVPVTP